MLGRRIAAGLAALALCAIGLPAAHADSETDGHLLDYPLPGTLDQWGGVYGWIDANVSSWTGGAVADAAAIEQWLNDQGIISSGAVTQVYTPGADDPIEINVDAATVSVGDCCSAQWDVGYVLADALGTLALNVDNLEFKFDGTIEFTADDIWAALPTVEVSVDALPTLKGTWSLNLKTGNFTAIGKPEGNPVVILMAPGTFKTLFSSYKTSLDGVIANGVAGANAAIQAAIANALATLPSVTDETFTLDVPFSFGYGYSGTLTNGTFAQIDPVDAVTASWLQYLTQPSREISAKLGDLTLRSILPTSLQDQIDAYDPTFLDTYDIPELIWNAAVGLASGPIEDAIDNFMVAVSAQLASLPGSFSVPGVGTATFGWPTAADIRSNISDAIYDKINGDWKQEVFDHFSGTVKASTAFVAGPVQNIIVSGVTTTPISYSLAAGSTVSLATGGTATLSPTLTPAIPASGSVAYTYAPGDSSIATVNAAGVITGVAEGSTTVTVTATITCPGEDPIVLTTTVEVTVTADEETDPTPVGTPSGTITDPTGDPSSGDTTGPSTSSTSKTAGMPLTGPQALAPIAAGLVALIGLGLFGLTLRRRSLNIQ